MSRRLLITVLPGETRAAWLEGDRLVDYLLLRADRPSLLGNRYLGRVAAIDRGLDAAFVEIGLPRPGLLPRRAAKDVDLVEGAAVVVEITREPAADKGAKLRAPANQETAGTARPPRLLERGADPLSRRIAAGPAPEEVVVDDAGVLAALRREHPALASRLRRDLDPLPLFEREGLEGELEALLEPEAPLRGGGRLWIEPVRTLTAVDVDAGGREGRGGAAALALETNLAAAAEIARQLRLRSLSGLIVVDFLEPDGRQARERVVAALREALQDDPEPVQVSPMRASGLVEIARRRGWPPLHELATEPCGRAGSGRLKQASTVAFELLRAALREAAASPAAQLAATAAPEVIDALDGPAAAARAAVEGRLGRSIALRPDPARQREAFEVIAQRPPP